MCPPETFVKVEEIEDPLPGTSRQGNEGAKAEGGVPKPLPLPKAGNSGLVTPKAEDGDGDDDVLTSLCALFDGMWPDNEDDDSGSESDETELGSPCCRGLDFPNISISRTYFLYGNNRYFFDQDHNVFLEGEHGRTTQIHQGRPLDLSLDSLNMLEFEHIQGLPYYFGFGDTLWSLDQGMNQIQVFTWTEDCDPMFPATTSDFFQNDLLYGSDSGFHDSSQALVSNGPYCDKTKVEADFLNPNPLQSSLQGQQAVPWSPSSSAMSPIVSTNSRASSSEPLEPLIGMGSPEWLQAWKEETKVIQHERTYVSDKLDRRRCRHCQKVFRRPSSLEDHLNVHSGAKPHICPYERCNTGFATKSNMKRHFETHRVGKLQDYARNGRLNKAKSLTATYNAKAFHTQRFRLVSS